MKILKCFSFVWLLISAATLFVACGGDDDDPQTAPTNSTGNQGGNSSVIDDNSNGSSPGPDIGNTNMTDTVVTGGVVDLGTSSVTIYGYVNHDDSLDILDMGIVYGTESDATKLATTGKKAPADSFDVGTNNRRFSVKITGLSPSTTYYYYAYAGQKTANDIQTFTTKSLCPNSNHPHMVDLGLPSGTLWACCNVGASAPEEYGNYYSWGETQPKSEYDWNSYQFRINTVSDIAGTEYDVATAIWGSPWRMPSQEQIDELFFNTTFAWIEGNGVCGEMFVGRNGSALFFPAAGYRYESKLYDEGFYGQYWSSTLLEQNTNLACCLYFSSKYPDSGSFDRVDGQSVRPVR